MAGKYVGGESNRTGVLDSLGGRADRWGSDSAPARPAPAAPAAPADEREVETSVEGDIDAEDAARWRRAIQEGTATRDEAQRHLGLDDDEAARLLDEQPAPAPRKTIEQQLAAIKQLRKTDERRYWSDAVQSEELRLLGLLLDGKGKEIERQAEPNTKAEEDEADEAEEPAGDDELAQVNARLAEIAAARKANPRSVTDEVETEELTLLERQEVLQLGAANLDPHLISVWRESGGLNVNLERARATAEVVRAELGDAGYAALTSAVDALGDQARNAILDALRLDPIKARGNDEDSRIDAAAEVIAAAFPDDISEEELAAFIRACERLDGNQVAAIAAALTR